MPPVRHMPLCSADDKYSDWGIMFQYHAYLRWAPPALLASGLPRN